MKVIQSVKITRFRSFYNESFTCSDINIFSGANNAGKSSVLRALNLFFNGEVGFHEPYRHLVDYNKAATDRAGGRRAVKIEIFFEGQGSAALRDNFSIEREFSLNTPSGTDFKFKSSNTYINEQLIKGNGNIIGQFRKFINKIQFIYIPAVRDRDFLRSIFLSLEQVITSRSENERYAELLNSLTDTISARTSEIGEDFADFIGMPTQLETPTSIGQILGSLTIQTQPGIRVQTKRDKNQLINKTVSIDASGDGIVMAYLPHFLSFVAKELKDKRFIWGFEEPENSLEYSRTQSLAQKISSEFSKHAQIFISTHSPALLNLERQPHVNLYRVYKEEHDNRRFSRIASLSSLRDDIVETIKQYRLFVLNREQEKADEKRLDLELLQRELGVVEFAADTERLLLQRKQELDDLTRILRESSSTIDQAYLLVEGHTDQLILQEAYQRLGGEARFGVIKIAAAAVSPQGGGGGVDALYRLLTIENHHLVSSRVLGLFDFEPKAIEKFRQLEFPNSDAAPYLKLSVNNERSVGAMLLQVDPAVLEQYAQADGIGDNKIYKFDIEDYFFPQYSARFSGASVTAAGPQKLRPDRKSDFARYITSSPATDFRVLETLLETIASIFRL